MHSINNKNRKGIIIISLDKEKGELNFNSIIPPLKPNIFYSPKGKPIFKYMKDRTFTEVLTRTGGFGIRIN